MAAEGMQLVPVLLERLLVVQTEHDVRQVFILLKRLLLGAYSVQKLQSVVGVQKEVRLRGLLEHLGFFCFFCAHPRLFTFARVISELIITV